MVINSSAMNDAHYNVNDDTSVDKDNFQFLDDPQRKYADKYTKLKILLILYIEIVALSVLY